MKFPLSVVNCCSDAVIRLSAYRPRGWSSCLGMCTEAHRPPSSVDGAFNKDNNLCCTPQELVPLWHNALRWSDQGRRGVVGVLPSLTDLPSLYGPSGLSCRNTDFTDDLSVFVSMVYCDEKAQEMQDFVMEGGGLLIGGHAWDWCSCNPELNPLTDFAGTSTTIYIYNSVHWDALPSEGFLQKEGCQCVIYRETCRSL